MSNKRPEVIAESNLSLAWGRAFLQVMAPGAHHAPLILTVEAFDADEFPIEDPRIRQAIDNALSEHGCMSVRKTAFTLFPNGPWEFKNRPDHAEFGPWFRKWIFPPMYRAHRANRGGTYFQRMVAFGADLGKKGELSGNYVDQLAKILEFWHRPHTHRRSALQAACFDPHLDHHLRPRSGFPCLQQVSLSQGSGGELAITGYYPSEYIFDRGYGNYLGLCHLGRYMARNMSLKLTRMNCVVGHPLLGSDVCKSSFRGLETLVKDRLLTAAAQPSTPETNVILVK